VRPIIVLFGLLCIFFLFSQPAEATWGTPYTQCTGHNGGTSTTIACTAGAPNTCASIGDAIVVTWNGYGNGTTLTSVTMSDGVDTYTEQTGASIGNPFYREVTFTTVATTSSSCRTFTVTTAPASTAQLHTLIVFAVHNTVAITAGALLDCATSNTFTTQTGGTQVTTGTCNATNSNDILVANISCNTGSTSAFEVPNGSWQHPSDWRTSSITSATTMYQIVSSSGAQVATYNQSPQDCVFTGGLYGVINLVALKSPDGAPTTSKSRSVIINFKPHQYKVPWDTRKRKLQIVSL